MELYYLICKTTHVVKGACFAHYEWVAAKLFAKRLAQSPLKLKKKYKITKEIN
jgi:hypothetical protein